MREESARANAKVV